MMYLLLFYNGDENDARIVRPKPMMQADCIKEIPEVKDGKWQINAIVSLREHTNVCVGRDAGDLYIIESTGALPVITL